MRKLLVLFFIGLLALTTLAQTADELYERAVNKYFLGNNTEAITLLTEALSIDPVNAKARQLLGEIQKEQIMNAPAPAPVYVPPQPAYAPQPVTAPSVSYPLVPIRAISGKVAMAHQLRLKGEEYLAAGDYVNARIYFLRVLEIMPGHQLASQYLEEIKAKLGGQPAEKPAEPKTVFVSTTFSSPALAGTLLGLSLFFLIIYFIRKVMGWWRSIHNYCGECATRNPKDAEFCRKCGNRLMIFELTKEQKEWFSRFSWRSNPFTLDIIPGAYAGHQLEISLILEKLKTKSGHILIIGGLGTGKTILLRLMEKNLRGKFNPIYVIRPPRKYEELIDLVSATISGTTSKTHKYSIYDFQTLCNKYNGLIVLLLDEAHEFSEEFEQFLRTLGDLPNVILVMAGLPQTREKLKRELPALFDRIVDTILLGSLNIDECRELIEKRIINSGGKGLGPFTTTAIEKLFDMSYGIPREILKMCDWLVTQAFRMNKVSIDINDVMAYSQQIKLAKIEEPEPAPAAPGGNASE